MTIKQQAQYLVDKTEEIDKYSQVESMTFHFHPEADKIRREISKLGYDLALAVLEEGK